MEFKLKNLKGTKDYLPEEQDLRNNIKQCLEKVFQCYGYLPLETPTLCYFDVLASKYAGGAEILKEVYSLQDQGQRELGLRYDLTVPFAKVIGMNSEIRMPFKRYEIGKVFRDGPIKLGRNREFTQCDVDVVGVSSMLAEAELMAMVFEAFDRLQLEVFVSYNNRKLLSGIIDTCCIEANLVNEVILSIDKLEKTGENAVRKELRDKGLAPDATDALFAALRSATEDLSRFVEENSASLLISEGGRELAELNELLKTLNINNRMRFDPFLARGLDIYTGTVFEVFLRDGSITSSIAGGGRYDRIIGGFLDNGKEYPAVGLSFGLDVIYTALTLQGKQRTASPLQLLILPMGAAPEALKAACKLRSMGYAVDVEMTGRKLKKSMEIANKEGIPFVMLLGEQELAQGCGKLRDMRTGEERVIKLAQLSKNLQTILENTNRLCEEIDFFPGIH